MPSDLLERSDPAEHRRSPAHTGRRARTPVDDVVDHLMIEFDGVVSVDLVRDVVVIGRRDLVGEVPAEALPEFLHRLARQRLTDFRLTDDVGVAVDGLRV